MTTAAARARSQSKRPQQAAKVRRPEEQQSRQPQQRHDNVLTKFAPSLAASAAAGLGVATALPAVSVVVPVAAAVGGLLAGLWASSKLRD